MKKIKVAAGILIKNGEVLIARRNYGTFEGHWEFPGGKVKLHETNETALKRELFEEMNIQQLNIVDFFTEINYTYPDFHLQMFCYLCTTEETEFSLNAHNDYKWIDFRNANNIQWIPADIEVFELLKKKRSEIISLL